MLISYYCHSSLTIWFSCSEQYLSVKYITHPENSNLLPVPTSGRSSAYGSARGSSPLPLYSGSGRNTPQAGSGGVALPLNPTTLALLQQHNYIPYFRGTTVLPTGFCLVQITTCCMCVSLWSWIMLGQVSLPPDNMNE